MNIYRRRLTLPTHSLATVPLQLPNGLWTLLPRSLLQVPNLPGIIVICYWLDIQIVSGGFGGLSAGFSKSSTDAQARTAAEAKLTSTKNQRKKAEQSTEIERNTEKTQKMVGELSINIIRYEMFLREVKPNYIHEDFLNCFMMLPQSFYAPKAWDSC